jgi:AcrR family transcriptional regulator
MSVERVRDRRAERFAATKAEILEAAWELAETDGLGALAMRELGARVGMRAQSLYGYFPSKHAIFDAMFAAANEDLFQRVRSLPRVDDPVGALRQNAHLFLRFCVESPVRYQLLFQRSIPGFEPSPESYQRAKEVLDTARELLDRCGITGQKALDVWTAVTGGLAAQQNANQPGGDRWIQLTDEVIDMYLTHFRPATTSGGKP